jgi:hypothetical protein
MRHALCEGVLHEQQSALVRFWITGAFADRDALHLPSAVGGDYDLTSRRGPNAGRKKDRKRKDRSRSMQPFSENTHENPTVLSQQAFAKIVAAKRYQRRCGGSMKNNLPVSLFVRSFSD